MEHKDWCRIYSKNRGSNEQDIHDSECNCYRVKVSGPPGPPPKVCTREEIREILAQSVKDRS